MDKDGHLFLTVKISVIKVDADADVLQLAMKALEKKPLYNSNSTSLADGGNRAADWNSDSSSEDERGGLELIEAFKHLQQAVPHNQRQSAPRVNYHISKNLDDQEGDADFSDEEDKRGNSNETSPKKNCAKTRKVINKVGNGAIGILGGALGISGGITSSQYDQQEELYQKLLKALEE